LIGGTLLFIIILFFPSLFGEGYESITMLESLSATTLLNGSVIQGFVVTEYDLLILFGALIIFKMIAAAITLGSGGNGGSFAPSLVIGAYLGFLFARLVNIFGVSNLPVSNFMLVAMAGILSGIFYAPLTAIFLIAEITGGYDLMIPLMIVSSLSLLVMHFFEPVSIESKKLSGMLHSTIETRDKLLLSRLELIDLVEKNFSVVNKDAKFIDLVKIITKSTRNLYPVVDNDNKLVGIISLDRIRSIMFDHEKYEVTKVAELMEKPAATIEPTENLHDVLMKFDNTNQWNLPVVENKVYLGFLSKSSILSKYRKELMEYS
jgi:CIC family chloride channel protein